MVSPPTVHEDSLVRDLHDTRNGSGREARHVPARHIHPWVVV
jgi:hypothetical protein